MPIRPPISTVVGEWVYATGAVNLIIRVSVGPTSVVLLHPVGVFTTKSPIEVSEPSAGSTQSAAAKVEALGLPGGGAPYNLIQSLPSHPHNSLR
jgi:hypothetical protein